MRISKSGDFTISEILEFLGFYNSPSFPSKEEIANSLKKILKKYHPDLSKEKNAHENTILLIHIYKEILSNYDSFKKEYEKNIQQKKKNKEEWNLLIIEYKSKLIALPVENFLIFVHKNDIFFLSIKEKFYIQYKNQNYLILNDHLENLENYNKIIYFGLFNEPFLFAIPFEEKIKSITTLTIEKNSIQWNSNFGIIKHQNSIIYIFNYFRNNANHTSEMSSHTK